MERTMIRTFSTNWELLSSRITREAEVRFPRRHTQRLPIPPLSACVRIGILLALCSNSQFAVAQQNSPPPDSTGNATARAVSEDEIERWIKDLGSDRFDIREQAAGRLTEAGEPAIALLKLAEQGTDLEVSTRANEIRTQIEKRVFDELHRRFLRDVNGKSDYGLPGWRAFSKAVGDSRTARKLFLQMLERQRVLAECIESLDNDKPVSAALAKFPDDPRNRLAIALTSAVSELMLDIRNQTGTEDVGDLLALFLGASLQPELPNQFHNEFRFIAYRGRLSAVMRQENQAQCMRKLLGQWLSNAPIASVDLGMELALRYRLKEGLALAKKVLDEPALFEYAPAAFQLVGAFGDYGDLDLVERWISRTELATPPFAEVKKNAAQAKDGVPKAPDPVPAPLQIMPRPGLNRGGLQLEDPEAGGQQAVPLEMYQCSIGDVALATGFRLLKMDLEKHFPLYDLKITRANELERFAFPEAKPEVRTAARDAWKAALATVRASSPPKSK